MGNTLAYFTGGSKPTACETTTVRPRKTVRLTESSESSESTSSDRQTHVHVPTPDLAATIGTDIVQAQRESKLEHAIIGGLSEDAAIEQACRESEQEWQYDAGLTEEAALAEAIRQSTETLGTD